MNRNPYSPPTVADIETKIEVAPRPLAVWLLLLLLVAVGVLFAVGVSRFISAVVSRWNELSNPVELAVAVVWRGGFFVALFTALVGVYRRHRLARWLGVAAIVGLAVITVSRPDETHYPNQAQASGALIGRFIFLPGLCVWWAYAFGFSSKAKRYFSNPAGIASVVPTQEPSA